MAQTGAWIACALNALALTPSGAPLLSSALLSIPLALLLLAESLRRLAWTGGMGEDEAWFSAVRVLFAGAFVAGCIQRESALGLQLACAPLFAFLVLRFRRPFPLASTR
ncbi:MAG: hypothetical protein IPJ19_17620 [Planctomycetes bacterium]|nr:hypothetical protein [Planctomycetota bacterium]